MRGLSMILFAAAAVAALVPSVTRAQPKQDLVKAELISDAAAVKPGEPFTVGIRLVIEPKWHVYWVNPGETGLPTKVEFQLPAGWTAGPVRFPVPKEFVQPGDIAGYGYEDEVVLIATVTPAAGARVGSDETIAARVSWLVCEAICIPGKADVRATVSVADAARPAPDHQKLIEQWDARVPVAAGAPGGVAARVDWKPGDGEAVGTVAWAEPVTDVRLFPGGDPAVTFNDLTVESAGERGSRIVVDYRVLAGQKPAAAEMPAVLAYTDAAGQRRGVGVTIPVGGAAAAREQARGGQ